MRGSEKQQDSFSIVGKKKDREDDTPDLIGLKS